MRHKNTKEERVNFARRCDVMRNIKCGS